MRFRFALVVVVLQVLLLAYLAGERERVVQTGRVIALRTAPIDPNDPMRGDYVRLGYDISTVPKELCRDGTGAMIGPTDYSRRNLWRDTRVYATLAVNGSGIAELVSLSDQPPTDGLFLRGRVETTSEYGIQVRYGIEAFFMQQGEAKKLEDIRRNSRPGAPMNMEVAVGANGIAVLKGYQWEPLGITVTLETEPVAAPADRPPERLERARLIGLTVTLKNHGSEDLAIVDLPEAGSFHLVTDTRWSQNHYRCAAPVPAHDPLDARHLIVLKPGQSHPTKIDLRQPRWFVTDTRAAPNQQKPVPISALTEDWTVRFRVEYSPPPPEQLKPLPQASLVRQGSLRSRAFNRLQGAD